MCARNVVLGWYRWCWMAMADECQSFLAVNIWHFAWKINNNFMHFHSSVHHQLAAGCKERILILCSAFKLFYVHALKRIACSCSCMKIIRDKIPTNRHTLNGAEKFGKFGENRWCNFGNYFRESFVLYSPIAFHCNFASSSARFWNVHILFRAMQCSWCRYSNQKSIPERFVPVIPPDNSLRSSGVRWFGFRMRWLIARDGHFAKHFSNDAHRMNNEESCSDGLTDRQWRETTNDERRVNRRFERVNGRNRFCWVLSSLLWANYQKL